ncbi:MAG: 50S ribosomal protein L17 [Verrucomicrobiia bacterium]|jgi:large subunit ribosomal protein L17
MRHRKDTAKLGMKSQHRRSMLANMVCSLISHNRITTTVSKAKEARRWADRMVTLAKKGTLHHRRQALAFLRQKPAVKKLFTETGKQHADRQGGYTRVIRIGQRGGDAAEMAILEWTGITVAAVPAPETKKGRKKTAKAAAPEQKIESTGPNKEKGKKGGTKKAETAK